jgi:hypothetical protein
MLLKTQRTLILNQWHAVCETTVEIRSHFLSQNVASSTQLFSVPSFLSYTCLLIFSSFPWSLDKVSIGKCIPLTVWDTACHWLHEFFWPIYSTLYCTGTQSPLYFKIQLLDKKCLATCKKVWVMLRVKYNVQLQVTTTWNVLWQSNKTKRLTHCRFLHKPFDRFFICSIRT